MARKREREHFIIDMGGHVKYYTSLVPSLPPSRQNSHSCHAFAIYASYFQLSKLKLSQNLLFIRTSLHPSLNPGPSLRSFLLRLLATQHLQPQPMRVRHMAALLHALPLQHLVQPRLEVRELLNVDAGPTGAGDPAPVRDVRDGDVVAD